MQDVNTWPMSIPDKAHKKDLMMPLLPLMSLKLRAGSPRNNTS